MSKRILEMIARETDVLFPAGTRVLRQPIWDTQTYTDNTDTSMSFFGTVRNDRTLGYVLKANAIPAPNWFYAMSVQFHIVPSVNPGATVAAAAAPLFLDDIYKLAFGTKSVVTFKVANNPLFEIGPVGRFPSGMGLSGFSALHYSQASAADGMTAVSYAHPGTPDQKNVFLLDPAQLLKPETTIGLEIKWSAAINISGNATIYGILDGYMITPPQGFQS